MIALRTVCKQLVLLLVIGLVVPLYGSAPGSVLTQEEIELAAITHHKKTIRMCSLAGLGTIEALTAFVSENPSLVNCLSSSGYAPLHVLTMKLYDHTIQRLEILLANDADINIEDRFWRMTPLHLAAQVGQKYVVEFLVNHGADTEIRDSIGRTALDIARKAGHHEVVDFLRAPALSGAGEGHGDERRMIALYTVLGLGAAKVIHSLVS